MNTNRCPKCRGMANFLLRDIDGHNFYYCNNGLTTFREERGLFLRTGRIVSCDTVINDQRKPAHGTFAYVTEGRVKTMVVTRGKLWR